MTSIRKALNMFIEWKPVGELRGFWTTSSLRGRWDGGIWDWTLDDNFKMRIKHTKSLNLEDASERETGNWEELRNEEIFFWYSADWKSKVKMQTRKFTCYDFIHSRPHLAFKWMLKKRQNKTKHQNYSFGKRSRVLHNF